jgi:hypothetical protein
LKVVEDVVGIFPTRAEWGRYRPGKIIESLIQWRSKVLPLSLAELQVENEGSMKAETFNILINIEQGTCDNVVSPRPAHIRAGGDWSERGASPRVV